MANVNYPSFFLHGFMGWGEWDGANDRFPYWGGGFYSRDLIRHLRAEGYECYAPSLGPFNSAWDRSCELWAIIMGGTVDYGKVHSEKYGHERYGRTYPGILKDWGKPGRHEKINIIGHSFGGPTVAYFSHLVANGDPTEVAGTPPEELSPLFLPNKEQKVHTVTSLSGVLNGTTFASWLRRPGVYIISQLVLMIVSVLGNTKAARFYDFHMEQWHMMKEPEKNNDRHFRHPFKIQKEINRFHQNFFDSIGHEMQLECMQEINKDLKPSPETYSFACLADRTHYDEKKGHRVINKDASFIAKVPAPLCCKWGSQYLADNYGWNLDEWQYNDGLVNVPGQKAPNTLPSEDAESWNQEFKKGIWYNMPRRENFDHMSWIGIGLSKEEHYEFYDMILRRFAELD